MAVVQKAGVLSEGVKVETHAEFSVTFRKLTPPPPSPRGLLKSHNYRLSSFWERESTYSGYFLTSPLPVDSLWLILILLPKAKHSNPRRGAALADSSVGREKPSPSVSTRGDQPWLWWSINLETDKVARELQSWRDFYSKAEVHFNATNINL